MTPEEKEEQRLSERFRKLVDAMEKLQDEAYRISYEASESFGGDIMDELGIATESIRSGIYDLLHPKPPEDQYSEEGMIEIALEKVRRKREPELEEILDNE
jgi:hypothetical protein